MKRCGACGEEFQNQYKFCPVDGEVLTRTSDVDAFSYSPTIISDDSLGQRLAVQVLFLIELLRVTWSQFKSDPVACRSFWSASRATFKALPSINAMLDARIVAARIHRPFGVRCSIKISRPLER